MNNDTVNETWIDKLVDELVDAKNEVSRLNVSFQQLCDFTRIILNNVRLDYSGEGLRIENDTAILEYLRVIYPSYYKARLDELKIEREAELKKLADAKAKESKGKKEA